MKVVEAHCALKRNGDVWKNVVEKKRYCLGGKTDEVRRGEPRFFKSSCFAM